MATLSIQEKPQHFLYLDGMRGVAAIFVGLLHGSQIFTHRFFRLPNAHLAVDFFFCLSGFVIAYAYADRLNGDMAKVDFLRRRFIRLGPVLFAGLLLGAFFTIVGAAQKGRHDLAVALLASSLSIFLVPAGLFFGKEAYPTNNPVWSLFFEIIANFVYAFSTIKNQVLLKTVVIIFAIFLCLAAWHFGSIEMIGFNSPSLFVAGFARVAFPFAAGVMIFRLKLYHNRRPIWSLVAFLTLPILLAFPAGSWKTDLVVIVFIIPAIVIAGTARAGPQISPFLSILGELSYPFYLVHQPILRALSKVGQFERLGVNHPFIVLVLSLVVALFFAFAVSRIFDLPFRRYLNNRYVYASSGRK